MEAAWPYTMITPECPARKAIRYFFEKRTTEKFKGGKITNIVTTINNDIKRTKEKYPSFQITPLLS